MVRTRKRPHWNAAQQMLISTLLQSKSRKQNLHYMRVPLQISGFKRNKGASWNVFHLWLSVLPSEVFPEGREGTWKRYLSMTVVLELVKAAKYCRQNSFCSVTQLKPGLRVTLNTYINVWTHGCDTDIFTFRYTGGPLWLFLMSHVSRRHKYNISFLECQLHWQHLADTSFVITRGDLKRLKIIQRDVQENIPILFLICNSACPVLQ